MSEPFLERLSRFTPDAGGLNRDELLFAAGRSSVRPNRGWMTAAYLLTATQCLSLVLLWPYPRPLPSGLTVGHVTAPAQSTPLERPASESAVTRGAWSLRDNLPDSEPDMRSTGDLTLIESGPPLRAFAPLPPSLLN